MERQKSVTARRVQWRCEGEREWTKITSNKKDEITKLEKEDGGGGGEGEMVHTDREEEVAFELFCLGKIRSCRGGGC